MKRKDYRNIANRLAMYIISDDAKLSVMLGKGLSKLVKREDRPDISAYSILLNYPIVPKGKKINL